jgi:hypothetical protein
MSVMLAHVCSAALNRIDAFAVEVEVNAVTGKLLFLGVADCISR